MNRIRLALGAVALIALIAGAFLLIRPNPMNAVIPSEPAKWDDKTKATVDRLSDEDKKMLLAYVMRTGLAHVFGSKDLPPTVNVGAALKEQRQWAADQQVKEALAEKQRQELKVAQDAAAKLMSDAVSLSLLGTRLVERQFGHGIQFTVGISNKTDRAIAGVRGRIVFIDMFGSEITRQSFSSTDAVAPQSTIKWIGEKDYNQFIREDRALANLEPGKYTTRFEPDMIVFKGGQKLAAKTAE